MSASALVDQYLNASDNDLKYMTLRQDLSICELDKDVNLLIKRVLMPVLLQETDPEIIELVSSQTYPQLVVKCIQKERSEGTIHKLRWFDDLIVRPLIEQINSKRTRIVIQTLRNSFKALIDDGAKVRASTEEQVRQLVAHMKTNDGKNMVIYWETLDLMIKSYYDATNKMSDDVLHEIFDMYNDHADASARSVLISSVKATASKSAVSLLDRNVTDCMLETVSIVWWQFNSAAKHLFDYRLIPSLNTPDPESVLQTIYNLKPFYQIAGLEDNRTVLGEETAERLRSEVSNLLEDLTANTSNNTSLAPTRQDPVVEDAEIDDDQQAYLNELQCDDELEFEEEEYSDSAVQDDAARIVKKCSLILKSLNGDSFTLGPQGRPLPSLDQVKVSDLTTEQDIYDVCCTAWRVLEADSPLPTLVISLDILGQLLQNNVAQIDYSRTCQALVPHMKQNKAFLQTLKVGNMTQTIDEGSTFRTLVYSTLLQIVTTNPVHYTVCCKIIMEALSRGVRDSESTINQLAATLIQTLLQTSYETIRGIDPEWYNGTLLPRVADIAAKVAKRLQATQDAGQCPDAAAQATINVLDQLTSLFNYEYPAIA